MVKNKNQSGSSGDNVPVIVYKKPQKKIRQNRPSKTSGQKEDERPNVKQFKLDVYRLLARSANASSSEGGSTSAKHSLAIALGAEPPKRKAVNYKQLQADLKLRRQQEKGQDLLRKVSNVSLTKKKKQNDKRRPGKVRQSGSAETLNGFGSFRGGVLRLSKDDVTRIKTTKSLKLSK